MVTYLVNLVLPKVGDSMSCAEYRELLINMGYSFCKAIGSLGGASVAGTIEIRDRMVTRMQ